MCNIGPSALKSERKLNKAFRLSSAALIVSKRRGPNVIDLTMTFEAAFAYVLIKYFPPR